MRVNIPPRCGKKQERIEKEMSEFLSWQIQIWGKATYWRNTFRVIRIWLYSIYKWNYATRCLEFKPLLTQRTISIFFFKIRELLTLRLSPCSYDCVTIYDFTISSMISEDHEKIQPIQMSQVTWLRRRPQRLRPRRTGSGTTTASWWSRTSLMRTGNQ